MSVCVSFILPPLAPSTGLKRVPLLRSRARKLS